MSNIITAELVESTTIESAAKGIATGLSNKAGSADACRWSYLANRNGISLEQLAKQASVLMAADPSSEKKSITKAAIEQRVAAFAFLADNELPFVSNTVCLAYTLAQKPTKAEEFNTVLTTLNEQDKAVTRGDVERELIAANKRALQSIKDAKANKPSEGGEPNEDSEADNKAAAEDAKATASDVAEYIRAQLARKWSAADKKTLIAALEAGIATLSV